MQKFAFLVHLRDYQQDLKIASRPLGWIPDFAYRYALRNRPLPPLLCSEITLTPGLKEAEGYLILLPYSAKQMLEQQKQMVPMVQKAMELAASKGAGIMGLGALTSPVTLGGKLVANNPNIAVTNGNAFTAVITHAKIIELIRKSSSYKPVVALVGATGSVGSLVALLLAKNYPEANYMLVARNERRLNDLAAKMRLTNAAVSPLVTQNIDEIKNADIVVLLTSSAECLLLAGHLKPNAVVLDDTQPRNSNPSLLKQRPDITLIDGGLVAIPHFQTNKMGRLGLPPGISFACLAETMLLAKAGYKDDFSIGSPTLAQAEFISGLAKQYAHLGFRVAPDHCFGKPAQSREVFTGPSMAELR